MEAGDFILGIVGDIIFDVATKIFQDKTITLKIQKDLKKAIEKSVEMELPNPQDSDLREALVNDIMWAFDRENVRNINLQRVIRHTFEEYGDENKDEKLIAEGIITNLPLQFMCAPELNRLIDTKLLFGIFNENREMINEFVGLHRGLRTIKNENQAIRELLKEILTLNKQQIQFEKNKVLYNTYIPEKYKTYFFRTLFLESSISEDEIATLEKVYELPKFDIMDQDEISGVDILSFIENFMGYSTQAKNEALKFTFSGRNITTLFVKGHAGSGKSSLFYYLAFQKSINANFLPNHKIVFIKLIELYKECNNTLSEKDPLSDILSYTGLEMFDLQNTLIVLDGLDEICTAQAINVYDYCNNLIERTFKVNDLKIIITTRLNYINISHRDNANVLNIKLKNWDMEDLVNWNNKYFSVHQSSPELKKIAQENINYLKKKGSQEILSIVAVPLLFYMVTAIGIKLDSIGSIGQLYDTVFDQLYARNYNENRISALQRCGIIQIIPRAMSRNIAMEIAYGMYQENTLLLKLNSKELKKAIETAYERNDCIELSTITKRQIEKLFPITFFYKEIEDVVEFAHKSIMEFFCAEKMFMELKLNKPDISEFIFEHMIKNAVTTEIMQFFIYFIETRKSEIELEEYKNEIKNVFNLIISKGDIRGDINKRAYGYELSKLVFRVYWIFIKEIIKCEEDEINNLLSSDNVRSYMLGVLSVKKSDNLPFICNSAYRWNFKKCNFIKYCFDYLDISSSDFVNSSFEQCSFCHTDLNDSLFYESVVKDRVDFSFSSLVNCTIDNLFKWKNGSEKKEKKSANVVIKHARVNNTTIKNSNMSEWIIENLEYTGKLYLISDTIYFKQFETMPKESIVLKRVTIIIDENIFTSVDINQIRRLHNDCVKKHETDKWNSILEEKIKTVIEGWKINNININNFMQECQLSFSMKKLLSYINKKYF